MAKYSKSDPRLREQRLSILKRHPGANGRSDPGKVQVGYFKKELDEKRGKEGKRAESPGSSAG